MRQYENVGGAHKLCSMELFHDKIQSMTGVIDNSKYYCEMFILKTQINNDLLNTIVIDFTSRYFLHP